jgi:hypothetical protein
VQSFETFQVQRRRRKIQAIAAEEPADMLTLADAIYALRKVAAKEKGI